MEKKLEYSFDDEVASSFCYDMDRKKIEIQFSGYFDLLSGKYVETPSMWVIENWSDAESKLSSESRYDSLEQHLGIVSMVLSAEMNRNSLAITVNTLDNRYVDLLFKNPQVRLVQFSK
jgi:hypothetical protein